MASKSRIVPAEGDSMRRSAKANSMPETRSATVARGNVLRCSTDVESNGAGTSRKRKLNVDGTASKLKSPSRKLKMGDTPEEKRLRPFRKQAPQSYLVRLDRVLTQRMFLIDRERKMRADGTHEEEVLYIAGTAGNVYQVTISRLPKCTCPDHQKGNQCKHIIYILVNVLKAPAPLSYQLAFLSTELTTLFANAPATLQSSSSSSSAKASSAAEGSASKRKPVEGDCPVCMMELAPNDSCEEIIFCRAACGNNIHRQCFEQWAASKTGQGPVRCVYCRSVWLGDERSMESIKRVSRMGAEVADDGYVNVARELGLSGERDWSSYHQPWVDRQRWVGYGMGKYR